jgi:phage terminase large subunit
MQTFFRDVIPEDYMAQCNFNKTTSILTYPNGSQIFFMGIDEPVKIGGLEIGWAFIDEVTELTEDDYIMILGRVRLNSVPFRQTFSATNPGPPTHWMYRRAFLENKVRVFTSSTLENPFLPADYVEVLEGFTGTYHLRYVLGKWVGFEGLVYGEVWDPEKHMVDPFEIPGDWPRYRSIDFGYTNPFVCQWWAQAKVPPRVDPEDYPYKGWYMYRELYKSQGLIDNLARDIVKYPESIMATIADWDAGDRAMLERAGVPTLSARKDVEMGIQHVYNMIANDEIHIVRGARILEDPVMVDKRKPTSTAEEFTVYKWPSATKTERNEKELPIPKDDHGMDSMRYIFFTLFGGVSSQGQEIEYVKKPSMAYAGGNRVYIGAGDLDRNWTSTQWS